MPQDADTGKAGRDFGVAANRAAASRFPLLIVDSVESSLQKTVLKDAGGRTYWIKNGRSTPTMSDKCLQRYHAVVFEDRDGSFYLVPCSNVLAHPAAKQSKSSGHGPTNPHTQLSMKHIRSIGHKVDPTTFIGQS